MRTPYYLASFFISLVALSLSAATLLQEDFSYTNGSLIAVSNGKWQHHSGVSNGELQVINGRVFLNNADTEDVNSDLNRKLFTDSDAVVYAQFTVNFTNRPGGLGTNTYIAHFRGGTNGNFHYCRIFAITNGASSSTFRVGIANHDDYPTATIPQNLVLNSNYTILARYGVSNATSTLWVNPLSNPIGVTATDIYDPIVITNFAFRQTTGIGKVFVDNLIVSDVPPFSFTSISVTNGLVSLSWESMPGGNYGLEASSNLVNWIAFATNLHATGTSFAFTTNVPEVKGFFRVYSP